MGVFWEDLRDLVKKVSFTMKLRSKTIEDIQKKFSEFHKLYQIKIES